MRTISLMNIKALANCKPVLVAASVLLLPLFGCSQERPSAIVIGAGLSGLNTALMLEDNGMDVTVLEARQRIGGRLYTLDDIPGKPEAGGNIIGPNYARIIDRAQRLGLEMVPATDIVGGRTNMQLYVDGQFIDNRSWATSAANPFSGPLKPVPPSGVLFGALRNNPLAEPGDWALPEFAKYDVPAISAFSALGLDARGLSLVNHTNTYGHSLETTSLLQLYHISASYAKARKLGGRPMAIAGGNQRLPEAMAAALQNPVLTGKVVTHIEQSKSAVVVRTNDGGQYTADYVVAAIPFTAMRDITIEPALPAIQQQAIAELQYTAALLAHLTVSAPYWGDKTPSVWSDTPIERAFATALTGDGEVSNVTLWISGDNALKFGAMDDKQRDLALLDTFIGIYPEAKGAVKLERVVDWTADPFSKGTWSRWQPGQISEFVNEMSKPAGRLYFAGEHTAISNTGMEGAMESSERVVSEMMRGTASAAQLFANCQACHSAVSGAPHKFGPNLHGFFGAPAASREGYSYSEAMSQSGLTWDRDTLIEFLKMPEKLVPGTKMTYHTSLNDAELSQLVDFLGEQLKE